MKSECIILTVSVSIFADGAGCRVVGLAAARRWALSQACRAARCASPPCRLATVRKTQWTKSRAARVMAPLSFGVHRQERHELLDAVLCGKGRGISRIFFRQVAVDGMERGIPLGFIRQGHRPLGGDFGIIMGNSLRVGADGDVFDSADGNTVKPIGGRLIIGAGPVAECLSRFPQQPMPQRAEASGWISHNEVMRLLAAFNRRHARHPEKRFTGSVGPAVT